MGNRGRGGLVGRGLTRWRCGHVLFARVEDLDRPGSQRIAFPGDLLAVIPLDFDVGATGPGNAALDAIVDAAHAIADLQRLQVGAGSRGFLLAAHVCLLGWWSVAAWAAQRRPT